LTLTDPCDDLELCFSHSFDLCPGFSHLKHMKAKLDERCLWQHNLRSGETFQKQHMYRPLFIYFVVVTARKQLSKCHLDMTVALQQENKREKEKTHTRRNEHTSSW
jgi:hypothetical protein